MNIYICGDYLCFVRSLEHSHARGLDATPMRFLFLRDSL